MESSTPPSGGPVGSRIPAEEGPAGADGGRPAPGFAGGGKEPGVSSALTEGAAVGGTGSWGSSVAVDLEGTNLELESRSCTSIEVVEVELGAPPERERSRSQSPGAEEGTTPEKVQYGSASMGGRDGRKSEKKAEGGEGGGGDQPLVVAAAAENLFSPGDFVWGKIKCHPWWPGQVYDPADASECARKVRRRDQQCVLVAHFGDRTFAWCDPSQLQPFARDFDRMARQSATRSFAGALGEALGGIQRCLELEMACSCITASELAGLLDRPAANAGIKEGVAVPRGRLKELPLVNRAPATLLERLRETACDVHAAGLMETVAIKGWFAAFHRWMGWHLGFPAEHRDGKICQGTGDVRGGSAPPMKSSTKSSHRKKVRSMAELIAGTDMETDIVGADGVDKDKGPATAEKLSPRRRKKRNERVKPDADEEGAGSGRRERKRSKYLSPPYTTLTGARGSGHHPGDAEEAAYYYSKKDGEAYSDSEDSLLGGDESDGPSPAGRKRGTGAATFDGNGAPADEMLSELQDAALDSMYLKDYGMSSPARPGSDDDRVKEFIIPGTDAATTSIKDKELEDKAGPAAEIKTPNSRSSGSAGDGLKKKASGSDGNGPKHAKSTGKRRLSAQDNQGSGCDEQAKRKRRRKKKKKKEGEVINGDAGAALFITFAAGVALPSREELVASFGRYGPLCETETELLKDLGCARVVFARRSDAEKVFRSSDGDGALGPGIASCRLQYLQESNLGATPPPSQGQKPPLQFVQKSLESMISALRESSSLPEAVPDPAADLKPEVAENLADEMHGLLKKVNKMMSGSAT